MSDTCINRGSKRLVSVQLLRIIACIAVFVVHFGQRTELSGFKREVTNFGSNGVYLFFIISGYLAAKALDKPNVSIIQYYKRRIIQILPLYYIIILWYFITENIINRFTAVIPADETGLGWFRYLFLLNGVVNSDTYFWRNLGATWTIPIFMFFYLVIPWIMKLIKNYKYAIGVFFAFLIFTKLAVKIYPCTVVQNLYIFFIGVVAYFTIKNNVHIQTVLLALPFCILLHLMGETHFMYLALFYCILVLAIANESIFVFPDKVNNIINLLDQHSYTFYLVHCIVFCSLIDRLTPLNVSPLWRGVIAVVLSPIATFVVHRWVEIPLQNLFKKVFK